MDRLSLTKNLSSVQKDVNNNFDRGSKNPSTINSSQNTQRQGSPTFGMFGKMTLGQNSDFKEDYKKEIKEYGGYK